MPDDAANTGHALAVKSYVGLARPSVPMPDILVLPGGCQRRSCREVQSRQGWRYRPLSSLVSGPPVE